MHSPWKFLKDNKSLGNRDMLQPYSSTEWEYCFESCDSGVLSAPKFSPVWTPDLITLLGLGQMPGAEGQIYNIKFGNRIFHVLTRQGKSQATLLSLCELPSPLAVRGVVAPENHSGN